MAAPSRDELLLDALRASGSASVAELARTLGVSEATVRRSLGRLGRQGRIVRTYGGAALADHVPVMGPQDPLIERKRAIGIAAAELIDDGTTVALSSGSTVLELARPLRHRRLTVITNALDVVNVLLDARDIELVVLGGVVLPGVHSLRGHLAMEALGDLRADTVFMGASAIDLDHGFMTEHIREIAVDRALRRMAHHAVILADSSKFERVAPGFMFGFDQVDTLVTDDGVRSDILEAVVARGTSVITGHTGRQPSRPDRASRRGAAPRGSDDRSHGAS